MDDPEIKAMTAVITALADLEEGAQGRVLRWAAERYGSALSPGVERRAATGVSAVLDRVEVTEEEIATDAPAFEHFADLFAKAQPKTDADRTLVAAYWLQAISGRDKWQAADLQKELKNLGHAIAHITDALTGNMRKKPQRIIQLQKAGSTRQARKTYKMTHEGITYVQGMLGRKEA